MNKIQIIGRLGKDPELKYTATGTPVANFSVATSEKWKDKNGQVNERTEWHRCVVWGKLGELCNQYLAKGRQVYIEGKMQTRDWEDNNGVKRYVTEVVVTNVEFLGSRDQNQGQGQQQNNNNQNNNQNDYQEPSNDQNFTADDIPF